MKKHLLILASLVLGLGQLMAETATFEISDLKTQLGLTAKVDLPYAWKKSPVTVTLAKEGVTSLNITSPTTTLSAGYTITVSGVGSFNYVRFYTEDNENRDKIAPVAGTSGTYGTNGKWTPAEGDESQTVTFTTSGDVPLQKIVVDYNPGENIPTATMGDPIEAIPVDNINTYTGSEPYVYSKADMTYYALNSLGVYEEYGVFSEVNTLKAAGNAVTEIEYLKSPSGAYINLNYIPKANSKAICTMVAETGGDWKAAYGCGYYQNGWKDRFCFFTTNGAINLGSETIKRDSMVFNKKIVTVLDAVAGKLEIFDTDGVTLLNAITDTPKTADCKTPLYVFAQNKDVPGGDPFTDCFNPFVTIYGLQLYEGETLVMDLVPAVNGEGKGGLKDKLTGTFYSSANSAEFELSADGQAMAGEAGIPVYEGKRVKLTTDNHEYKYQNGEWLDCGAMALEEITDTDPSYKDMRNWKTNNDHMSIFAGFTYDGTTNEINPYKGTSGYEPYMFQIPTIAGQDYNWSFTYSGSAYNSWHSTPFHAFVTNDYNLGTTAVGDVLGGNIIGIAEAFPFAGVEDKAYSIDFNAKQSNETLVVQFGDVDDGDKGFWFKFANLKVSKYIYPLPYEQIDLVFEPEYTRYDADGVGYAILAGGNGWGDSPLSALLDNDAKTKFGTSSVGEAWAIIIASEEVAVQQYSLVTGADTYNYPSRNPASWKLEGSNDNKIWTLIDEKVQTYQLKSFSKYENVIEVNGTEKYKYFKFTATQLGDGFQMGEFWINGQAHAFGDEETAIYDATCTIEGKVATECTDCGAVSIGDTPALGHDYNANGVCARCNSKVSEVVLLPTRGSNNTPYFAKFRHENAVSDNEYVDIEEGWANVDFDDSAWDELMMPLGTFGPYHTRWFGDYNTFWFRRTFNVSNPAEFTKLTLKVTHDDDCAVFLNGKKVWNEFNWTANENDWRTVDIAPADLVEGKNVLAMYMEQNFGGAYCDFGLEATLGATVEVGEALYATFVAPCDVDFTGAEVSAFAAQPNADFVHLEAVTTVPAGTAVVVKADEAGTYVAPKTLNAALGTENALVAAAEDVTTDGSQFILSKEDDVVGFYRATAGTTIAKGKGYLVITGEGVKAFYGFDPDNGTGISGIGVDGENTPIYNLAGQRLGKMQKGVNVMNGKKVLK